MVFFKQKQRIAGIFYVAYVLVTLGCIASVAYAQEEMAQAETQSDTKIDSKAQAAEKSDKEITRKVPTSREEILLSFAPLVKQASPAVVNIYTKKKVKVRSATPFLDDPLFQHFFGNKALGGQTMEKVQSSLGSGVIVRSDGLIITCYHEIVGSEELIVVLSDRREFDAKPVLFDEKTDLALLKIEPGNERLAFLEVMDSDQLQVGDIVLAVGNPFGVGQTVTNGIVSALARTTVGAADYQFFIQTDAAINPGNSGGALLTMNGKLAGINSSLFSNSGGNSDVGFAIPANMAATVIKSAYNGPTDHVVRPWVGISVQPVTQAIAQTLGMKIPKGALVSSVSSGGPASDAGIKEGDVVVGINDHNVEDGQALYFRVATYDIGTTAMFHVIRNGDAMDLPVRMIAPPESPKRDIKALNGNHPLAGATVANLSPALADELGLSVEEDGGVIVTRVGTSIAASVGLNKNDIIRKINGEDITSTDQLTGLLKKIAPRWELGVVRGNRSLNIIWSGNYVKS